MQSDKVGFRRFKMWHDTKEYEVMTSYDMMWYNEIWYNAMWHGMMWYDVTLHYVMWHDVISCNIK